MSTNYINIYVYIYISLSIHTEKNIPVEYIECIYIYKQINEYIYIYIYSCFNIFRLQSNYIYMYIKLKPDDVSNE